MPKILIIDDDIQICKILSELATSMGHTPSTTNRVEDGLALALKQDFDLVLLDLEFPNGDGLQILPDLLKAPSNPEVIIITGTSGYRGAELAFKHGAWDYVEKPFILAEVSLPIERALQYREKKEADNIPITLDRFGIIGESSAIRSCLEDVARASTIQAAVLVTGETGTGKELFARAIHTNSKRASGPFTVLDCSALPLTLAESTLFGHEKGAFTGAEKKQDGVIRQANNGTLFLDEIGELSLDIQKLLLRVLQEHRIRPVGSVSEIDVDFRLVAATNRDIARMVKKKQFREDLYFRIRAIEVAIPPLRDRKEDIYEITTRKVDQLCRDYGIDTKGVSPEFMEVLVSQRWPGNVRELINALEFAIAMAQQDPILFPKHLPPEYRLVHLRSDPVDQPLQDDRSRSTRMDSKDGFPTLTEYRTRFEKNYLRMLLRLVQGNRREACRLSGVSQARLYGLLKKYNLSRFTSS
jgi:DNA-binding NtrC family response regulator